MNTNTPASDVNSGTNSKTNAGPLAGIKVIEMSTVVFGPYGSQILADLGAEVIKVEDESGDIMRKPGNPPVAGMGPIFMALNRNKNSIQLNLAKPKALEAMCRLLADADVFYSNVRLAGLERLGLSYADLKEINPNIIYVHCTGFSSQGPYAGRAAYDDLVQAASGFADLLPRSDGSDAPRYMPSLVADKTAGLHAAYATMAALFHRERCGQGQFVEVPMFEAFTSFNMVENLYGESYQPARGSVAYTRSIDSNRKPYKTKDGYISIMPYSANDWQLIMREAGIDNILSDPRFDSYENRTKNISVLYAMVHQLTPTKSTDEWMQILQACDIPCSRVNRLDEVKSDPHLLESGFFEIREHPQVGQYYSIKHPVTFSKTPANTRTDPPILGQHTSQVLGDIGYTNNEIDEIIDLPKS